MKLVDSSVRRPVTVLIFSLAALIFGKVAFDRLATDLLPDVTYPSLTIRTGFEGAAPIEVESLVTRPVENAVGVVDGLVHISSSSRAEVSEVTLEFGWGTSMDFAALDVRERLDFLRLPLEIDPPMLLRYDPGLDPILRLGLSGDDDLIRLRRLAEERLQRALERVEGVAAAVVQGGLEEEIQVEIDERRLSALGMTIDQLQSRLSQENVNLTGGRLRDGQTELLVRTLNEILRPEDLQRLVIQRSGNALVRLEDIAEVRRGFREREIITRINGRESVEVAIYKAGGTNTVTVAAAVAETLAEIEQRLAKIDPDLEVTLVTDQAAYIRSSVREVLETASLGGLLAILVLFLFLRSFRTTGIIAVAIPLSVVATFFLMYLAGISLNIMSLGGLTLGIGLLVDNAIVVLEAIQRRRERGEDLLDAARDGASEVATAIIASTFTSLCVFLPIVFVEGVAAQFFADQALTVTFSLLVSLLVALTVIPMLASRRWPPGPEDGAENADSDSRGETSSSRPWRFAESLGLGIARGFERALALLLFLPLKAIDLPARWFLALYERAAELYGRLLDRSLAHPWIVVSVAVVLFVASLGLYGGLGQELVPELIQGEFFVDLELPPGTHLDVTQRRVAAVERFARLLDGVDTVYAIVGSSGQQGGVAGENRENRAQITVTVTPPFDRAKEERLMSALRAELSRDPELEAQFGRPSYFSFKTPIEIELRGYNLDLLRRLSDRMVADLSQISGFADVESSAEGGTPELRVRFDRDRLASFDLSLQEVASIVRSKVQGTVASEVQRDDRTIDIRVRAREQDRNSVADLRNLVVAERGGASLSLESVAEVEETVGPVEIRRSDGERAALITANLEGRDLAAASAEIGAVAVGLDLPGGFDWLMGGQQEEMQKSFQSMRLALFLAVFLVYLVMASQFESLLHPLVILGSVPLSLIGVLVMLSALDIRISLVVLIGVVLLAGIVVNNAIILVDTANRLRRQEGLAKLAAVAEAGRLRLRPILMTTSTTVLGLLPMAVGLGEGSELRAPMALAVIGGLLSSTALTLVVIPAVYLLLDRGE